MQTYVKGFVSCGILILGYVLITGSILVEKKSPYNMNKKPGRYLYERGVDWKKNDISTWVDTQNGIAIISYIDSKNEKQLMVSTYSEVLEIAKENITIED